MLLKPDSMTKVTITGPKTVMETVIGELHRFKILHIVDHSKKDDIDIGNPLEKANKFSEILVKLGAVRSHLNIKNSYDLKKLRAKRYTHDFEAAINKIHNQVSENIENLKAIESKIIENNNKIKDLNLFRYIPVPLDAFSQYKSIVFFVGFVKDKEVVKGKIEHFTDKFDLYSSPIKGEKLIVLFVESRKKDNVAEILKEENFIEHNISSLLGMQGTSQENIKFYEKEIKKLNSQKESINSELNIIKDGWHDYLIFAEEFLVKELEKSEAPLRFAATKNTFVIKGWVPVVDYERLKAELREKTKDKIFIYSSEPEKTDNVPVKLKNPNIAKPFEFLMDLYTLPNYKEIDPTFFAFLTFPLLFGFMLGDFGYGFVTLIIFYLLKKKFPNVKALLNILIYSSLATIFFGLLFGEFFGLEHILGRELPHILSRSHQITLLLYVAIAIGVVHVNMGLIIGFFNELSHGIIKAVNEKISWIVLQAGVALLALSYMKTIALPVYVGYATLALAIFMLYKGEGVRGLVEVPSIFSNILSYARLMAIGIASVKLAEVVNEFAAEFFHHGGLSIVYGVLLLVIGHTINMGLGILGPFLHSLRLHYVEFFTKFFKGGGIKYNPFGVKA